MVRIMLFSRNQGPPRRVGVAAGGGVAPRNVLNRVALPHPVSQPRAESVRFGGVTGTLADRHWMSPKAFQNLLNIASTPYIGRLPDALRQAVEGSPKQVYQALDELAPLLRKLRNCDTDDLAFRIGPSNVPVTLHQIGSGSYGIVYRLTVNQQSFALKVYHHTTEVSTHGSYGESATGLYFSQQNLKDVARFHFGNPKAGWGVFELITSGMSVATRKGQSIKAFPVVLEDDRDVNRINGIRVDYGGILKSSQRRERKKLGGYPQATVNPDSGIQASNPSRLYNLPQDERYEAFLKLMQSKQPFALLDAVSQIDNLPEQWRYEAFNQAMHTGEQWVQAKAASKLFCLSPEFRVEAFRQAIQTTDIMVQANALSQLKCLPTEFRQEAFEWGIKTHIPALQSVVASEIYSLPEEFINTAFQRAMQTRDPLVQSNAALGISQLPPAFRHDAFEQAMQTEDPSLQEIAVSQLFSLPSEVIPTIYHRVMQTQNPMFQASAASQIGAYPWTFRQDAFQQAMKIQDPRVQASAASQISSLPPEDRQEAFEQALQTNNPDVQASAASQIYSFPKAFRPNAVQMYADAMARHGALQCVKDLTLITASA